MTPFLGSKSKKKLSGVGFSPKPIPDKIFIEIGVGVRTPVSRSLLDGLLNVSRHILYVDCQYFSLVHFVSNLKKCSKYHDPVRLLCISEHRYVLNVRKS